MKYPRIPNLRSLANSLELYTQLQAEYGAKGMQPILSSVDKAVRKAISEIRRLPVNRDLRKEEPDSLQAIRKLRPRGPRALWKSFDRELYQERLRGALLGRLAGCTLGAPVEGWEPSRMEEWAKRTGDRFPPVDYWSQTPTPLDTRCKQSLYKDYTRDGMRGVPVDDDIAYTLLGLLIAEDYGLDFTTDDVGKAWMKYLPLACTAEEIALNNLKKKVPTLKAAEKDNPYVQWIGADIRSDPCAYLAPALPERAADMAYRDAYLSHRRNGIYGEMFFAAAQAAAFAVSDPVEAVRIGLTEIPAGCLLARDVRWALSAGKGIRDYRDARAAVDARFAGMHKVHTNNNACLTVFGLMIGGRNLTRVISQVVAMGLDNDCTAATAGSIVGAVVGGKGVPTHWYRRYNDTVHSYLIGKPKFSISGLLSRFEKLAAKQFT